MRSSFRILSLMLLCVVGGAVLSSIVTTPAAVAQSESVGTPSRYQISAYSGVQGQNLIHGAYIIDAATGKTWHVRQAGSQQVLLQKLP